MRRARRAALLLLAAAIACGKKGDPQPPLARGPRAVSDLAAEQEGAEAVLTFSYPDRLLTGAPLTDLAAIEVYRVVGASPALAAPRPAPSGGAGGPSADRAPGAGARRAAQNVRQAEEAFYRDAKRVAELPAAALSDRTVGASVLYRDPLLALLEKERGKPIAYAVASVRRNGERSPISNIVLVTPEVPPGPPEIVRLIPEEGRICLEWIAPEKDLAGDPARVGGYLVYRRSLPQEEYEAPLAPKPGHGTAFVDWNPPYGAVHFYTVRAVLADRPRVEGPPAPEIGVDYRDLFPPPAPSRLAALPEASLVRLVWDPVPSADLAGYLLFRSEEGGPATRLTERPIADTFYTDSTVVAGRSYRYTVRAVDAAGNVSAPSPEALAEPFGG